MSKIIDSHFMDDFDTGYLTVKLPFDCEVGIDILVNKPNFALDSTTFQDTSDGVVSENNVAVIKDETAIRYIKSHGDESFYRDGNVVRFGKKPAARQTPFSLDEARKQFDAGKALTRWGTVATDVKDLPHDNPLFIQALRRKNMKDAATVMYKLQAAQKVEQSTSKKIIMEALRKYGYAPSAINNLPAVCRSLPTGHPLSQLVAQHSVALRNEGVTMDSAKAKPRVRRC